MTTNTYIIKSPRQGVLALTINELKSENYSTHQLLKSEDNLYFCINSLNLLITNSHLMIASTQNCITKGNWKKIIDLIKLEIADVWDEECPQRPIID